MESLSVNRPVRAEKKASLAPPFDVGAWQDLPLALYWVDARGYIQAYNPAAEKFWGRAPELGHDRYSGALHHYRLNQEAVSPRQLQIAQALKGKDLHPEPERLWFEGAEAKRRFAEMQITVHRGADEKILGATCSLRDLTNEVLLQQSLEQERLSQRLLDKEAGQFFRILAESLPQIMWVARPDGETIFVNRHSRNYTGMPPETSAPREWRRCIHSDDLPEVSRKWREASETRQRYEASLRLRRWDGVYRWLLVRSDPVLNDHGELLFWVGTATDIQEQKLLEDRLLRSSQQQTVLAELTNALVASREKASLAMAAELMVPRFADMCIADLISDGVVRRQAVVASTQEDPACAKRLQTLAPDSSAVPKALAALASGGNVLCFAGLETESPYRALKPEELPRLEASGLRHSLTLLLRIDANTVGALTFLGSSGRPPYDDKDRLLAEELGLRLGIVLGNAQLYRDLQGAIRSRDEFLSIASHELRTPLTSLKLQAQMFKRWSQQSQSEQDREALFVRAARMAETTNQQVDRLTRLIDDMLDISRISTGRLQVNFARVDIARLLRDCVESFSNQFQQAGVAVNLWALPELWIKGDAFRLEQVLTNLFTNAIRYAPGHPIEIRLSQPSRKQVLLEVADQGPGISLADQKRIFERFERGSQMLEAGLGLGLFISREIVNRHGGHISVQSEPGQGACFSVELPADEGAQV